MEACPADALAQPDGKTVIKREICTLCGICAEACYSGAIELVGFKMTVDQLITEIQQDSAFYDQSNGGVTFSGGEPLLQAAFLSRILQKCNQLGIHTAIDTCGYVSWKAFEKVIPYTSVFLYDLKFIDPDLHLKYTGLSNGLILDNLQKLSALGKPLVIRVPIVPGANDSEVSIRSSGEFLAGLPALTYVELLAYHGSAEGKYAGLDKEYLLLGLKPPEEDAVSRIAQTLKSYGLPVKYNGGW